MAAWVGGRTVRCSSSRALWRTVCPSTWRAPTYCTRRSWRCCVPVDTAQISETVPSRSTGCRLVLLVPPVVDDAAPRQEVLQCSRLAVERAPRQPQREHHARGRAYERRPEAKVAVVPADYAQTHHGTAVTATRDPPADCEVHHRDGSGRDHGEPSGRGWKAEASRVPR